MQMEENVMGCYDIIIQCHNLIFDCVRQEEENSRHPT